MPDRELEQVAVRIAETQRRQNRKALYLGIVIAAFVFAIFQTFLIFATARITGQDSRELARRIDRNAEFSACVLAVDLTARTNAVVEHCLKEANERLLP